MPRQYKPEAYSEYGGGMFSDITYPCCRMVESHRGEWVKLETFNNTTAQLRSQIESLKRQLRKKDEMCALRKIPVNTEHSSNSSEP